MINRGKALEPRRNVVLDPVMPPDFVEQFGHEARDFADALDLALLTPAY